MKFVIEHLDSELFEWCIIEYEHISGIVGKENLIFTNIKGDNNKGVLKKFGEVFDKSVADMKLKDICILDSNAEITLASSDKNKFENFVFGGILGDSPPQHRTMQLINSLRNSNIKFESRNLGKEQMPTDTAVIVANKILCGERLEDMNFSDGIEIEISENESVLLPYRYLLINGNPDYSKKLAEYLKKKKEF